MNRFVVPYVCGFLLVTFRLSADDTAIVPPSVCEASPTAVLSLDQLAGDWIPVTTTANPPDVHNFHDMLLVDRDLTSFFSYPEDWLWWFSPGSTAGNDIGKLRSGYSSITLTLDGREFPAVEYRWYPYRALRRNQDCGGLAVERDTRMINEQRAVLVRVRVSNPGPGTRKVELALAVPGQLQGDGVSVLNTTQRKGFATAISPAQKPMAVVNDKGVIRWHWTATLPSGGEQVLEFVAGDGHAPDGQQVVGAVSQWAHAFAAQFEGFKRCWEQRWADAFTPGNKHFSGHLPVLTTDNAALTRNYYMGVATLLAIERTQFPVYPRTFVSNGERGPGTHYVWDAALSDTVMALLEPAGMKATTRRWLVQNVRITQAIALTETTGYDKVHYDQMSGSGYAFNASQIFQMAFDYLRVTGDLAFLDETLENGQTVLKRMDDIATDWKTMVLPDSPLENCGENQNLLECAPAYIHRVPSVNAQNVLMMRQAALLYDLRNNSARAKELRADADKLVPAVLDLYKPGTGVWNGLHKNGQRVELRHCMDYIYVGNALAGNLSPTVRREMTDFVKCELFTRDWMRAMSLKDAAATNSDRPDHGPMGAFDGWVPLTVGAMWRLGFPRDAFDFYCRTTAVTKEGPFTQAHEFYGPNCKQYDAPVRIAERQGCFRECIDGAAFTDVVINTFFGFSPSPDDKTVLVDPGTRRPFHGTLGGVRYRGRLLRLVTAEGPIEMSSRTPARLP